MKLSSIIAVETTTYCNRECEWCPNSELVARDMTPQMFDEVISTLKVFPRGLLSLVGCGEPLMDPDIIERVHRVAKIGYSPRIITNGDLVTEPLLYDLKKAGICTMIFSEHSDVKDGVEMAIKCGINATIGYSPVNKGRIHNWAGQLDWHSDLSAKCNPLLKGRGYISIGGYVCQCCMDYNALYPIGHVCEGRALLDKECVPIPLCKSCGGSP